MPLFHHFITPHPHLLLLNFAEGQTTAFQTGEALELLTNGRLAATPHFVSGNAAPNPEAGTVSRETFAFFLQYVRSPALYFYLYRRIISTTLPQYTSKHP